ncbi:hypothetical protein PHJA_000920700 [Phtheirospermum japonicum]|uniref:Uncharacterized protein n=1 Tax=Phtheirospermum japonicum TaxID=374723 RepID=A0A830BJI6_9LAMI|nr:hypothetical protein PHJA_000920700 [Phtheirospermum japonicum]
MESSQEIGSDRNMNSRTSVPWSSETNWLIAHGSLEASITVESPAYPVAESDSESAPRKSPLVLKPPRIRGLIRYLIMMVCLPDGHLTRVYEDLCFDQKYDIGQIYVRSTARVYEVYYARSPRSSSNEYLCTVRCGVAERDDILLQTSCIDDVVEGHSECLSGEINEENGEDIVTSEDDWVKIKAPDVGTSSVHDKLINTDRAENVQDLYEATAQISDADPCFVLTIRLLSVQDKGLLYVDEVYVFGDPVESTDSGNERINQSSLMAIFVPTLMNLSKSGVRQVQDKRVSDEVLEKDNNNNKMDSGLRRIDETGVVLEVNQVNEEYVKPKEEIEKDIMKEPVNSPPGHLERALEQLISRVSRVEDICLRFEEKLMKPIQSIEARLEQVEHQLQKLADINNSKYYGLPRCTRISAPAFSCSEESLSSSFHNEQSDFTACGASEIEKKDFSCNNTPESLSQDALLYPSLIVSAPEFPCDEDEEEDNLESPKVSPKKALSVDDALAAALNGFLSSAIICPCDEADEENQKSPSAEKNEEIGNDEHLNYTETFLDMAFEIKNEEIGSQSKCQLTCFTDPCDFGQTCESESASIVDLPAAAAFELETIDVYFGSDDNLDSKSDQDKDSVEAGKNNAINGFYDNTNPDDDGVTSKQGVLESVSSRASSALLDFEFPILEVEFASDVCASAKSPLEALLAESDTEVPLIDDTEQINAVILDVNETSHLLPINDLLIDKSFSAATADGFSNLEGGPHNLCGGPEMNVSLI